MYVAITCCIMTCSISKGFVTYHGSMECEINVNVNAISTLCSTLYYISMPLMHHTFNCGRFLYEPAAGGSHPCRHIPGRMCDLSGLIYQANGKEWCHLQYLLSHVLFTPIPPATASAVLVPSHRSSHNVKKVLYV